MRTQQVSALWAGYRLHHLILRDAHTARQGGAPCLSPHSPHPRLATCSPRDPGPASLWFRADSLSLPVVSLPAFPPPPSATRGSLGWGSGLFSPVCQGKSQPVLCLVYNWFGDSTCLSSPLQSLRGTEWLGGDTLSCPAPVASCPPPALGRCALSGPCSRVRLALLGADWGCGAGGLRS